MWSISRGLRSTSVNRALRVEGRLRAHDRGYRSIAPSIKYYLPHTDKRGPEREASILQRKPGDIVHGFELLGLTPVPEYKLQVVQLKHKATGADYVHVDANDLNNAFSIIFKTPPSDSTGVPHILEHSVLCGSRTFPTRDPFFNMLKRSLNTFMNAMTASDHTMYPFATTNETDFANLMAVYLDAVFFPNLRELDFKQEGHRLELSDPQDLASSLVTKGVVYNEMKGTMSDVNQLFATRLQQLVYPEGVYSHDSGGDPVEIPKLTWDGLRAFHKKFYHPSNCLFYSYGDLPVERHLQYLDADVLSHFHFDEASRAVTVDPGPGLKQAVRAVERGPPDMMSEEVERQVRVCQARALETLAPSAYDPYESLVVRLISVLLLNGPAAPLYKALIESGLATDYSPGTGLDGSTLIPSFGVGVQGTTEDVVDKILETIQETFQAVVHAGFDRDRVESILHQIELGQKHLKSDFGISTMYGVAAQWTYGRDILDAVMAEKYISRLTEDVKDPEFLKNKFRDHFLNSTSPSATLIMKPDPDFVSKAEEEEQRRMEEKKRMLTEEDLRRLVEDAKKLAAEQDKKSDTTCLPSLSMTDISPSAISPTVLEDKLYVGEGERGRTNIPIQWVPFNTNGVVYMRFTVDASAVPNELKQYLPLFSTFLTQLGAGTMNHAEFSTHLSRYTGGISTSSLIEPNLHDASQCSEYFYWSTYCLERNVPAAFDILTKLFLEPRWDNKEHMFNHLLQLAAAASESIAQHGSGYARRMATAMISRVHSLKNEQAGLPFVEFLQREAEKAGYESPNDGALEEMGRKMREIGRLLLTRDTLRASIVCEEKQRPGIESGLRSFISSLPSRPHAEPADQNEPAHFSPIFKKKYIPAPLPVNFVALTVPSAAYMDNEHPYLEVLAQLIGSCYLHREVREKGGAYGVGANQSDGVFTMSSFYDPHVVETLEAYQRSLSWAANGSFSDRDVEEALLPIFGELDAPHSPSSKGYPEFVYGMTHEIRQNRRNVLLGTTKDKLVRTAESLLERSKNQAVAVLGQAEAIQSKESPYQDWDVSANS